jgi:hypothetical protein
MKPQPKEKYQHFKGKSRKYEIVIVEKVNGKQIVFYKSLYEDKDKGIYIGQPFSRSLKEFIGYKKFDEDYTNYDGKLFKKGTKIKRFTLVKTLEDKING